LDPAAKLDLVHLVLDAALAQAVDERGLGLDRNPRRLGLGERDVDEVVAEFERRRRPHEQPPTEEQRAREGQEGQPDPLHELPPSITRKPARRFLTCSSSALLALGVGEGADEATGAGAAGTGSGATGWSVGLLVDRADSAVLLERARFTDSGMFWSSTMPRPVERSATTYTAP